MEKLTKAKVQLILSQPFFATLLMNMNLEECSTIPTMCTNGEYIKYNPKFIEAIPQNQIVFVLCHEILHCVFEHCSRVGERDLFKWNIATDLIINDILVKDHIGEMPKDCLFDSELVKKGKELSENVYNLLPENKKLKGSSFDELIRNDKGKSKEEMEQASSEMKIKVAQALNAARMAGKLSENLKRIVGKLLDSTIDWKTVLRNFITEKAKTDWSFAKPKRRFLAEDIYLPGMTGEQLGDIVVAIDCSGSVDEKILTVFASELKAIFETTRPTNTHVIYFDSQVLNHNVFGQQDDIYISPTGGGGTAFSPIFKYVESKGIVPKACVVLTDLQCADFGPAPNYSVLWATTDETVAPWGRVLPIKVSA